jgi:hypothetical protein
VGVHAIEGASDPARAPAGAPVRLAPAGTVGNRRIPR